MWQISVTSFGAKRILIGVGYLNADEKLHGSIIHDRLVISSENILRDNNNHNYLLGSEYF